MTFITGPYRPGSLIADGSHLFWVNDANQSTGQATTIGSAAVDSSGGLVAGSVTENLIPGADVLALDPGTGPLAVYAGNLYWKTSGLGIDRVSESGTGAIQTVVASSSQNDETMLAVDGQQPDTSSVAITCRPTPMQALFVANVSVAAPEAPPNAKVKCTITTTDRGPAPNPVSGSVRIDETPSQDGIYGLDNAGLCPLVAVPFTHSGRCSLVIEPPDPVALASNRHYSLHPSLTVTYLGRTVLDPSSATVPFPIQRVNACHFHHTIDGDVYYDACIGTRVVSGVDFHKKPPKKKRKRRRHRARRH